MATSRRRIGGRPPAAPASERGPNPFERIVQAIGLVAAPLTLITALLFYVGWVRTEYVFNHFGIDLALVGLSDQDYLLRSVDGIYVPLGVLLSLGLIGLWTHGLVRRVLVDGRRLRAVSILGRVLLIVGGATFLLAAAAVAHPAVLPVYTLFVPLMLGIGITTAGYGRWLLRCLPGIRAHRGELPKRNLVELTLISLILVLALFWAATEFAAAVGRGRAEAFAAGLASRPGIVLYSSQRLFLNAPGVQEDFVSDQPAAAYHYRYRGLRLFAESQNRLFLLPPVWRNDSAAFVIDYGPGMRVELTPGAGA